MIRAHHGADAMRPRHCQSAKVAARRLVRGDPNIEDSKEWWPGAKEGVRSPSSATEVEPQGESDDEGGA